jgi:uncharacterized membrane protein YhhN
MTSFETAGLAVAVVVAVLDWLAVARDAAGVERWAKPTVIGVLIATVLLSDPNGATRSQLLAIGLAASLVGDRLLLPPERFLYGLVAFFVAHVAYAGMFLVLGPLSQLQPGLAAAGLVGALAVAALAGRPILAAATRANLRRPVAAYLGAILLMAVAGTASGSIPGLIGAWLFIASDTVLGWDRFVAAPATGSRQSHARRLAVLVPYHGAQLLLAAAVLAVT